MLDLYIRLTAPEPKLEFDNRDIGVYLELIDIQLPVSTESGSGESGSEKYIRLAKGKSNNLYDISIEPPQLVGKISKTDETNHKGNVSLTSEYLKRMDIEKYFKTGNKL